MPSTEDPNDAKASATDDTDTIHPEVDIIWHNMYTPSTFVTWRKQSSRSVEQLLVDFTDLASQGVFKVISLSVGKASFVAVVACERDWEDIEGEVFKATR